MKNLKDLYLSSGILQVLSIIFWFIPSFNYTVDGLTKTAPLSTGYTSAALIAILAFFVIAVILDLLSAFISSLRNKHLYILSLVSALFSVYNYISIYLGSVDVEVKTNVFGIVLIIINVCLLALTVITLISTVKLSKESK